MASSSVLLQLCISFTFLICYSVESFTPETLQTIDSLIENNFLPINEIPGFGLAIVKDNDLLSKGYGLRDVENKQEADTNTLFAIGSITKSFTATIIVKTLNEIFPALGENALDVPIRKLLPSINFTLSDRFRSESTSFRDLLSHRMCTNRPGLGWGLLAYQSKDEFLFRLRYAREVCSFRTNFVYNNGAYFMAGEIIAEIANSTFETMLTNLLRELEMKDTIIVRESDDYNVIPNMSRAYYRLNGEIKRFNTDLLKWVAIAPAPGGILTTSADMVKYMQFHLNNGKVGDTQIVSEKAMTYLRRSSNLFPTLVTKTNPKDVITGSISYGLGFSIGLLDGWEAIGHSGYLNPFRSHISMYPALKLGIYTVGPDVAPNHELLHKGLYEIIEKDLRNLDMSFNTTTPNDLGFDKISLPILPDCTNVIASENIIGTYGHAVEGEFVISQVNGSLRITYGVWGTGTLKCLSSTTFIVEWDSDIIQFFAALKDQDQRIDFSVDNVASVTLSFVGIDEQFTFIFRKNLTIDQLPIQPWAPDSCGPS